MVKFEKNNNGYKYFVVFIDIFTRYLYTVPLKSLQGEEMVEAMKSTFSKARAKPLNMRTDKGSEYKNRYVKKFLKDSGVNHIFTNFETKANYAERVIKTIKLKLFKYLTYKESENWVSELEKFTKGYNKSFHRSLKMSPLEALDADSYKVWQNLYQPIHGIDYNNYKKGKKAKDHYLIKKQDKNNPVAHSEFLLLLIYVHCPSERETIVGLLEEKDLLFSLSHHRFLWLMIHKLPIDSHGEDSDNLLRLTLQENMVNHPEYNAQFNDLFNLRENDQPIVAEPQHYIQSAIACLESIGLEKYKQYCKQKITQLNSEQDLEKIGYFYQELLTTESQLKELVQQRMH